MNKHRIQKGVTAVDFLECTALVRDEEQGLAINLFQGAGVVSILRIGVGHTGHQRSCGKSGWGLVIRERVSDGWLGV